METSCTGRVDAAGSRLGGPGLSRSYRAILRLQRPDLSYEGALCICRSPFPSIDPVMLSSLATKEWQYYVALDFEKRRKSYVLGRYTAKKALSALSRLPLEEIPIEQGVFNHPLVDCRGAEGRLETSISHTDTFGAALAFPAAHPMGIDIEVIDRKKSAIMEGELTEEELALLKRSAAPAEYGWIPSVAWTVKEALSKVLKTGLTAPLSVYEISSLERMGASYLSHFRHFTQYKAISFNLDDHICSIVCPRKTSFHLDLPAMLNMLL